jgi:hypothetical protein
MSDLKLIALDAADLSVVSAHLQDAVLRAADIAYLPGEKRFAAVVQRFDWFDAIAAGESARFSRRQTAVRIERVTGAQVQGIDLAQKDRVLSLLALCFEPGEPPEGHITLRFADGAAIRLQVECIEVEMKDLGPAWQAKAKPKHPDEDVAEA